MKLTHHSAPPRGLPSRLIALFVLALLWSSAAQAQLTALRYDRSAASSGLATADAGTGVLTSIGTGDAGRVLGLGVNAFDPFALILYALGPDPAGSNLPWLLYGFDQSSGAALAPVSLDQAGRITGAVFDQSANELLLLRSDASGNLELLAVDPASGVLSLRNSAPADCCAPQANAVSLLNGVVYLAARLRSDPTPRLLRIPTDGSAADTIAMSDPLVVLRADLAAGVLYGLRQAITPAPVSASLTLVQVNPASGAQTPIGSALPDCCAVAPGISAISNGALVVVAQAVGASAPTFLSFDLSGGMASFAGASIDPAVIINGLFDQAKGLEPTSTTITAINPMPAQIGQPYSVSVSVTAASGPITGNVTVSDGNGSQCLIVLPAASCNLTSTVLGPLTITASYTGENGFAGSSDTAAQSIVQAVSTTTITSLLPAGSQTVGQPYTVNVLVSGFMPSGLVAVSDGAGANCNVVLPASSCDLSSTVAGPKTISASYAGDANNSASADSAPYTIDRAASSTSISAITPPGSSVVGDPYTVEVSVSGFGTPTGDVTIDDGNGASCLVTLPASSCQLTSTSAGATTVSASYGGDSNNLPSAGSAPYTIDRAPSTTTISAIAPPISSPVGAAYTVTVGVSGFGTPSGDVSVDDGNGAVCLITLPATSCQLTSVVVGPTTISASYAGDGNNLPSADTEGYEIVQAASGTTITMVAPNPATVGAPYTVTVDVSGFGPPTGDVAVDDGDGAVCTITLPATSCDLVSTTTGPKTITAAYPGDGNNLPSSDSAAQQIDPAESVTSISGVLPAGSQTVGQPYTVNVSVTGFGPPTGTVAVSDGTGANCSIVLPATSCDLLSMTAGPKTLTASYPGDGNNAASSDSEAYTIDQASSTTSFIGVTPPGSSVVGVAYQVEASVTGFGTPTGSISIDDGSGATCSIALPSTSCVLTSTSAGPKTLSANYSGDGNNSASSATLPYQIDRAASTTNITTIVPAAPTAGTPYTVSVSVGGFGTATGTVQVDDGAGASCVVTLPASDCELRSSVAGALTITAGYAGDGNNLPSSATQALLVGAAATSTLLSADPNPVVSGMPLTLTATVNQGAAIGVPLTGTVDFLADGNPIPGCTAVALASGAAQCATSFSPAGDRSLVANYSGDGNNLPSSGALLLGVVRVPTTTTISLTPASVPVQGPVLASITVSGGVAPLSGTVSLSANGDPIDGCQTLILSAGQTSCAFQLAKANSFEILAVYSGDEDDQPSSGTATLSVNPLAIPVLGPLGLAMLMLLLSSIGGLVSARRSAA
jgi:hypothetical protein